jgi:cysteine desulfurase
MWANNETGVIQPVEEISRIARMRGILFHTDAVQVFGKIPVDVVDNPIDMLSISGHKLYGPRGVGVLYVRRAVRLEALVHGGGQERGVRGGTENLPGIVAMAEACRLAIEERDREAQRIASLRDSFEERILNRIPGTSINGNRSARIPNTSNITFRGAEGEAVISNLDEFGIAASSASACAARHTDPSRVLLAMGLSKEEADASVRFSLGRWSEVSHVERLLDVLPGIIERLRSLTSESGPGDRTNAG